MGCKRIFRSWQRVVKTTKNMLSTVTVVLYDMRKFLISSSTHTICEGHLPEPTLNLQKGFLQFQFFSNYFNCPPKKSAVIYAMLRII